MRKTVNIETATLAALELLATDRKLTTTASIPVIIEEKVPALSGLILDVQDKPLPGVTLKVATQGAIVATATTDEHGYYLIIGLPPGAYRIKPEYRPKAEEFSTEAREKKTAVFSPSVYRITLGRTDERAVDFNVNFE